MGHIPPLEDFDDPGFDPFATYEFTNAEPEDAKTTLYDVAAGGSVQEGDLRVRMGLQPDMTVSDVRWFIAVGERAAREVLQRPDVFSVDFYKAGVAQTFGEEALIILNGTEHSQLRRIFQKAFMPGSVASWVDTIIDPIIHELIDAFSDTGQVDLVSALAAPFPFEVIFRLLQLPKDEGRIFHRLSIALLLFPIDVAHGREAREKLGAYFGAAIRERRQNPGNDLVSVLATTEVDGEYIPEEALISFFRQILIAGSDTTYRTIGCLLLGLLSERPDQFEMLKQDRSLIPQAVEEALRWESTVTVIYRMATSDTELDGVSIPKGAVVQVMLGVANRDPRLHQNPEQFDITRPPGKGHLAFAAGPHVCLGLHLARLEITRMLNIILDRLPNLRLDTEFPPSKVRGFTLRTPASLHARFD